MKNLIFFLFLSLASIANCQKIIKTEEVTDHSSHIIGNNFEGVIFYENYHETYSEFADDSTERNIKRFSPSSKDIILVESILNAESKNKQNKGDRKFIFNHLAKYRRQYIGYVNNKGDKIIYINSFPVDEDWADKVVKTNGNISKIPRWYDSLFIVLDGGNSFWQVHINLNRKKIIDISVNGVA